MKPFILLVLSLALLSCTHTRNAGPAHPAIAQSPVANSYSDAELATFLDSIGKLDPETLNRDIKAHSDSVFKSYEDIGRIVSAADLEALKKEEPGPIANLALFSKLFPEHAEFFSDEMMPGVVFYQFSKNKFDKFAVELNGGIGSWVYFFSGNKIVAHHNIYHKYGLELESFVNAEGRTVVYYKVNYLSGTDIFHDNYNFYMYTDHGLIPVLNELENSNLGFHWSTRSYWLESTIAGTVPLAIKMVYEQTVSHPDDDDAEYTVVKDSAIVKYNWDERVRQYVPDLSGTGLSSNIILTYYLADNELLFINTHHAKLKEMLNGSDIPARKAVSAYLTTIMGTNSKKEN